MTITPYENEIEPNVPDKEKVMEDFKKLSDLVGVDSVGCMTIKTFETALHEKLNVPKRKVNQRNEQCACFLGVDIGAYDTCGHFCKYCYANTNRYRVKENMRKHDPKSPFLIGNSMLGDVIHEARQESYIEKLCLKYNKILTSFNI